MTQISPVSPQNVQEVGKPFTVTPSYNSQISASSLESMGCGSNICGKLCSVVLWPVKLVGRIAAFFIRILQKTICCCFKYSPSEDKLNREKARVIVAELLSAVIGEKHTNFADKREAAFEKAYKELRDECPAALKLFHEHLRSGIKDSLIAKGKLDGKIDEELDDFVNAELKQIKSYRKYIQDLKSPLLINALKSFYAELKQG